MLRCVWSGSILIAGEKTERPEKMARKLYRSLEDRRIAGICGGVAEYFNIDPTIVRLIAAMMIFTGGGILVYLVAWLIIPYPPVNHQDAHVS